MASSQLIELIKVLRDRTGAGMMDCKKALEENNLDVEKACDWLREKGIAKAAKKATRIAAEGMTYVKSNGNDTVILEINCETDFVARGDAFQKLVADVADILLSNKPSSLEEAKELINSLFTDATVKLGEKLDFRRFEIITKKEEESTGTYIHMGGKISVACLLSINDAALAKGLAMHIAANNPSYISKEDVPQSVIDHEKAIQLEAAKTDEKLKNKPQVALEQIIVGKINKALSESILSEQAYLLEGDKKVAQVLLEAKAKVIKFIRYQVGEGIEKRVDDFANEVLKEIK